MTKRALPTDSQRCIAAVYVRDTYRYTGRGPSGFELHFTRKRCARWAAKNGRCWQHQDPSFVPFEVPA